MHFCAKAFAASRHQKLSRTFQNGRKPGSSIARCGQRPARPACSAHRGRNSMAGRGAPSPPNAVVIEELAYSGFAGPATDFSVHSDVCCGYLLHYGTEDQKKKWLPRMVSGETVCAIAMTEPGTGSDLQGIRTRAVCDGDDYVISGQKTFISNGQMCDLVIAVTPTNPAGR